MPFQSKQQAKYLYSQHPEVVKKWKKEGVDLSYKKKPKRVKGSKATPQKTRAASRKAVQSKRKKAR